MSELNNIRAVTRWVTSDHKEHYNESAAQFHAGEMDKAAAANAVLEAGGSVADALRASWKDAEIDPILERITMKTRLVVSHWQCQETPGYKVRYFNATKSLHVYGHAGSWSGSYGGNVSPQDLVRYARNEATDWDGSKENRT